MTCAKQTVICTIVLPGGEAVYGTNRCAKPQPVCPREPGEGYEKCRSICGQYNHAELVALHSAEMQGIDVMGGRAIITGHDHVCDECERALYFNGVEDIRFEY